ncbi:MAG: (4Fe-4S)-binding protein [bacterium]|nr:(4Fe-4S)-binding protein [bacterium]
MYIAVTSGKGGTGKTLVSTTLALCAGECTYIDLDVEEPNGFIFLKPVIREEKKFTMPVPEINNAVCTFCGKCAESCVYNALGVIPSLKKTMFFPELCHSCGVCGYVCPTAGAITEVEIEIGKVRIGKTGDIRFIEGRLNVGRPSGVPLIGGILRDYPGGGGLVIGDSPPGTSCPVVESLKSSDYVILVTEPTPFGLNDLKLTVEVVKEMGKKAGIIINKDSGRGSIIEGFAGEAGVPILLRIPYSLHIQETYSRGIPLLESMPGIESQFKTMLDRITCNVVTNEKSERNRCNQRQGWNG